ERSRKHRSRTLARGPGSRFPARCRARGSAERSRSSAYSQERADATSVSPRAGACARHMIIRSVTNTREIADILRRMGDAVGARPTPSDATVWADLAGEPMGILHVCYRRIRTVRSEAPCALLSRLWVHPEHWGRSVSLALLEHAVRIAETAGARIAI